MSGMPKLTEDEKFIMAVMAGVEIELVGREDFSFHFQTKNPCGIAWLDNHTPIVVEGNR